MDNSEGKYIYKYIYFFYFFMYKHIYNLMDEVWQALEWKKNIPQNVTKALVLI